MKIDVEKSLNAMKAQQITISEMAIGQVLFFLFETLTI